MLIGTGGFVVGWSAFRTGLYVAPPLGVREQVNLRPTTTGNLRPESGGVRRGAV